MPTASARRQQVHQMTEDVPDMTEDAPEMTADVQADDGPEGSHMLMMLRDSQVGHMTHQC